MVLTSPCVSYPVCQVFVARSLPTIIRLLQRYINGNVVERFFLWLNGRIQ